MVGAKASVCKYLKDNQVPSSRIVGPKIVRSQSLLIGIR